MIAEPECKAPARIGGHLMRTIEAHFCFSGRHNPAEDAQLTVSDHCLIDDDFRRC
jgi:hypothetical protein